MPYRDRQPTLTGAPAPPSQRVQEDTPSPTDRADDPVAVLRAELAERDRMIGGLLGAMSTLEQKVEHLHRNQQQSLHPPKVEPDPDPPTPAAWKAAVFKLVVSLGAVLTAAATWLGIHNATAIPPKVDANEVRTTVNEKKTDVAADELASLKGRVAMLENGKRDWLVYWLEFERVQGVQVKRPEGLADAPKLDVTIPLRHSNDGPSLYVNTPPP